MGSTNLSYARTCITKHGAVANISLSNNKYHSAMSGNNWFEPSGSFINWVAATGETGSQVQTLAYTDPNRDISTYMTSIGGMATLAGFINAARTQSRCSWNDNYTAFNVNNYIRIGFSKPVVLAIDVLDFEVQEKSNTAQLSWSVANPKDIKHIDIQRSMDGISFEKIATVNAKQTYFLDKNTTTSGIYYYRLVFHEHDGSNTFSAIQSIKIDVKKLRITVFPNPCADVLNISLSEKNNILLELSIYNAQGQLLEKISTQNTDYQLNIKHLPVGQYFLKIKNELQEVSVERFVKINN